MWSRQRKMLDNTYFKIAAMQCRKHKKKRKSTNNIFTERETKVEFLNLYRELRRPGNEYLFYGYTRMMPTTFDYIVKIVKPQLEQRVTNFQRPVSVEERVMLTLR